MRAGVFAAVVATLFSVALGQCNITLPLDPLTSTFTFNGSVIVPVVAALGVSPAGTTTGFQGSLTLELPGACPSSGQALLGSLGESQDARITGSLAMYPGSVVVRAGWAASDLNSTVLA